MDLLNTLCLVFGALGVGGWIASIAKFFAEKRRTHEQRVYNEKKEAYLEYIKAIAESQMLPEKEGGWLRTQAMFKIRLFGSLKVIEIMENKVAVEPGKKDLMPALKELYSAMRDDLNK